MNNFKKNKGITLVALIITIVVLIILAGVLINISLGNNGLFNKAKTAKEMYVNVQTQEETEIAKMTNNIDGYVDGNRGTVTLTDKEYAQFKSLVQDRNKNYNYSTEEQVIGTWINGKPIYQRTININANAQEANTWANYDTTIDFEIDELIDYIEKAGLTSISKCGQLAVTNNNGKLRIAIYHTTGYYAAVKSVTIQYTKTTDTATN